MRSSLHMPAAAAAVAVALGNVSAAAPADASSTLTVKLRRQILTTVAFGAPNSPTTPIRDPACVRGYLSTVDRRYAAVYLSNTKSCVRRFGAASGEGLLVRRGSPRAARWRQAGHVGDNCMRGEGGASDAVLEDLHCTVYPRS